MKKTTLIIAMATLLFGCGMSREELEKLNYTKVIHDGQTDLVQGEIKTLPNGCISYNREVCQQCFDEKQSQEKVLVCGTYQIIYKK